MYHRTCANCACLIALRGLCSAGCKAHVFILVALPPGALVLPSTHNSLIHCSCSVQFICRHITTSIQASLRVCRFSSRCVAVACFAFGEKNSTCPQLQHSIRWWGSLAGVFLPITLGFVSSLLSLLCFLSLYHLWLSRSPSPPLSLSFLLLHHRFSSSSLLILPRPSSLVSCSSSCEKASCSGTPPPPPPLGSLTHLLDSLSLSLPFASHLAFC